MGNNVPSRDFAVSHGRQYGDVTSLSCRLNSPATGSVSKQLFRQTSKKTSKLCIPDPLCGNPPVTGGFTSQTASTVESVSMWRRRYGITCFASAGLKRGPKSWITTHVNDSLNGDIVCSVRFQLFDSDVIAIDLFCLKYWYMYNYLFHNKPLQKWILFSTHFE